MLEAVGIIAHTGREQALTTAKGLVEAILRHGWKPALEPGLAKALEVEDLAVPEDEVGQGELVVALGGDGTLLAANRSACMHGTPVLGIHVGGPASFGFLTETTPDHACEALQQVFDGNYQVEERLMIRSDVIRRGELVQQSHGLNDLVVRAQQRMLKMRVTIRDTYIATYAADGIIVATPTGSTAYNLAAGGPLVHPAVETLLLTPICPHTLNVRSLLTGVNDTIRVVLESGERDVTLLTVDGQQSVSLEMGDELVFCRSEYTGRFISLDGTGFYEKVHTRLRLGERFGAEPTSAPQN